MHWCPRLVWVVQARTFSGCACGKEAARCALAESTAVAALGLPVTVVHYMYPSC